MIMRSPANISETLGEDAARVRLCMQTGTRQVPDQRGALGWCNVVCRALLKPVINWRARRIAGALRELLDQNETVLDYGTGDGIVARALVRATGCTVTGIDTITYGDIGIPFVPYDGKHIPFPDD